MKLVFGLVAATLTLLSNVAHADELSEARVRELVLDTIRKNPEIIREAIDLLQKREEQKRASRVKSVLSEKRETFERDPDAPVLGNPDGGVTVVEFFDYNCPYCKRTMRDVKTLISDDKDIGLVYREFPILGEGSLFASRAALASRKQDKYEAMHWALMSLKRANEKSVLDTARKLGLDLAKLKADMKAPEVGQHIQLSMQLAQALNINGTPSFIIGDTLVPGVVPLATLQKMVADTRASSQ